MNRLMGLFSLSLLIACTSKEENHYKFRIYEENGVTIAETIGGPKYEGELFKYSLDLILRQDSTQLESLLARPVTMAVLGPDRYVVADGWGEYRLVFFNGAGQFLRAVGGVGSGPGEFRSIAIMRSTNGNLSIFDRILRRLTVLNSDGQIVTIEAVPSSCPIPISGMYRSTRGQLVAIHSEIATREYSTTGFSVMDETGSIISSSITHPVRTGILIESRIGQMVAQELPFAPHPASILVEPHGILVSDGEKPRLVWYTLDGQQHKVIDLPNLDLSLSDQHRQDYDQVWDERITNASPSLRAEAEDQKNALLSALGSDIPPWTFVSVDDQGFYWLRIPTMVDSWVSGEFQFLYHILSPTGEYIGITRTPPVTWPGLVQSLSMPVTVANSRFLAITHDSQTGEPILQVYRITSAIEGFAY